MIIKIRKENFLNFLVTLVVLISPLLAMYGIGYSTITLLDVSLLIVICLIIVKKRFKNVDFDIYQRIVFLTMILILINFFVNSFFLESDKIIDVFLRTLRFEYYLFFLFIMKDCFSIKIGVKIYKIIAIFATLFLIFQNLMLFGFGISIKGYLPFFPIMREELVSFSETLTASSWARPRSIFAEPSQYGLYVSGYLAISLLNHNIKDNIYISILLSIGCLMSVSTTAIITTILLWLMKTFKKCNKNNAIFIIILSLFLFITFLFVFSTTSKYDLFIQRLQSSYENRFGGFIAYNRFITNNFSPQIFLLGVGMDLSVIDTWASGLAKILFYFGLLGLMIFLTITVFIYKKINKDQKSIFFVVFLMGVFSELWVSNWIILFFPFILNYCPVLKPNKKYKRIYEIKFLN